MDIGQGINIYHERIPEQPDYATLLEPVMHVRPAPITHVRPGHAILLEFAAAMSNAHERSGITQQTA